MCCWFMKMKQGTEGEDFAKEPWQQGLVGVLFGSAAVSWIRQSNLPITGRLALQNNVLRTLLALNRMEAEYNQIGRDTRLVGGKPTYVEWYLLPQADENYRRERAQGLWRRLKYEKLGISPYL
jgi:hypothetical protein